MLNDKDQEFLELWLTFISSTLRMSSRWAIAGLLMVAAAAFVPTCKLAELEQNFTDGTGYGIVFLSHVQIV